MSGMAEVLAAHAPNGVSGYGFEYVLCTCDRTNWMKAHEFPEHQLAALTAAGFGPVKEAKAVALEEAADELKPSGVLWCGSSGVTVAEGASGPPTVTLDGWLRTRATAVRGEA